MKTDNPLRDLAAAIEAGKPTEYEAALREANTPAVPAAERRGR